MKVRAIALQTFGGLLRNRLIVLFLAGFLCILLLMMSPLLIAKSISGISVAQSQSLILGMLSGIMSLVSGFGSLLAAWATADAVSSEMRSGTILAVMARPVRRWEFLLGKYLGVQLLMVLYVLAMFGLGYLLAWIGGQAIQSTPWVLLVYPMVRYAVYGAIALLLVTVFHPVVSLGTVLLIAVMARVFEPSSGAFFYLPGWLRAGIYAVLPSTGLLSETRFLVLTQASLQPELWTHHLANLAYGLDYALVCFLLAVWLFRTRSLSRL
jgi:ABC-type transport system involved in multi-copper enzyme maturation permease subunit